MQRGILLVTLAAVALVVGSSIALAAVKFGTAGSDELVGTNGEDVLYGKGGSDGLAGKGEDDVLYGGGGGDSLDGDSLIDGDGGEDVLFGGRGVDCIYGGPGDDVLRGGPGTDYMGSPHCSLDILDTGNDIFYGGSGDDRIVAAESIFVEDLRTQQRDIVFCGPGKDEVKYVKGVDRIFDCEISGAPATPLRRPFSALGENPVMNAEGTAGEVLVLSD